MDKSISVKRTTKIKLSNDEFREAIVNYLKSKEVQDAEHHVDIDVINTRSEEGVMLDIVINNYNKDNNIFESLKN